MRKLLLSVLCAMCCTLVMAQSIDIIRGGGAFSKVSSNATYMAGNMEDLAFYYNAETKQNAVLEGEVQDDGGCFVWDLNDKGQLAVDWKKQAAIWTEDGFEVLPMPEGLTNTEKAYSAARCISNDGNTIIVSFGDPTSKLFVYTLEGEGEYAFEELQFPEEDPIFHQKPSYIAPCGMSEDGKRFIARYRIETGFEELPLLFEKGVDGKWSYRWVAPEFIVVGGSTEAEYPGEYTGDIEDLDAYREYEEKLVDYYLMIDAVATGYFYDGQGDLSGMDLSANGRYVNLNVSYQKEADDNAVNYAAVIDLNNDSVYVFTGLTNAACMSVTNDGVVSLASPRTEYFRYAYISSVENPGEMKTLTQWTLEQSNNAIDMAAYMTYNTPDGPVVAEGGAILLSGGTGYVTTQYNGFEDNQQYDTYIVRFDTELSCTPTYDNSLLFYDSANGVLNFVETLENVEVFDVLGRRVYSVSSADNMIDFNNFVSGTYFVVAYKGGERISAKFIVK